jgi:hypothetical protein
VIFTSTVFFKTLHLFMGILFSFRISFLIKMESPRLLKTLIVKYYEWVVIEEQQ